MPKAIIPKADLKDATWYIGHCRNASRAMWDAKRQVFIYERHKFGETFHEDIYHPEDDQGFDTFKPYELEEPDVL